MLNLRLQMVLAAFLLIAPSAASAQGMSMGMPPADTPAIPPVAGFSEGADVYFLHTEASDRAVATMLSEMMGSPVLYVPSLADIQLDATAPVYVFTNGLAPDGPRGPLGFQPDVLPFPPGDDRYSPLREIIRVTWTDPTAARMIRSEAEIAAAVAIAEVTLEPTGIIVNMPMVTWPNGRR